MFSTILGVLGVRIGATVTLPHLEQLWKRLHSYFFLKEMSNTGCQNPKKESPNEINLVNLSSFLTIAWSIIDLVLFQLCYFRNIYLILTGTLHSNKSSYWINVKLRTFSVIVAHRLCLVFLMKHHWFFEANEDLIMLICWVSVLLLTVFIIWQFCLAIVYHSLYQCS